MLRETAVPCMYIGKLQVVETEAYGGQGQSTFTPEKNSKCKYILESNEIIQRLLGSLRS